MKKEVLLPNEQPEPVNIQHAKEHARKISIQEGSLSSISSGFAGSQITPFALAINSQPFHIGILSSIAGLISPLAQVYGSKIMKSHPRKKIVVKFVFLEAIMWLPIIFLIYLFSKNLLISYLPYFLIVMYALIALFGGVAYPPWFSWMGDIVPEKIRGSYFSKRNTITGTIGIAATLIASFLLDYFKTKGLLLIAFLILFALGTTFRLAASYLFTKQYSPQIRIKKHDYFSFIDFVKRFDNFGKYAVYQLAFNFAIMVASPFFAVYMLKELNFSYLTFTIVSLSTSMFHLLFMPLAGKFSDKYGNLKLLYISGVLFIITPILWMFLKSPIWLIFLPGLSSGIANAALAIGATNFTYSSVRPTKLGICVAYTNILAGIGAFFGGLLGSALIKFLPIITFAPFVALFGISAFFRFLSSVLFLPKIKETMHVKHIPPMHIHLTHPFKTIHHEIGWFRHIFK